MVPADPQVLLVPCNWSYVVWSQEFRQGKPNETSEEGQIREAAKPDTISILSFCILALLPATMSLPIMRGSVGQYPLVTMAGFPPPPAPAISCSLPGCERLREEGASAPRGTGRCWERVEQARGPSWGS